MEKLIIVLSVLFCLSTSKAQKLLPRSYLEVNGGFALLDDQLGIFPGASFLIGQQRYFGKRGFFEYQGGLALPSIITAKTGVGLRGKVLSSSIGVRIFPAFVYGQLHINLPKGQLNFSAEGSPFYAFNELDIGITLGTHAIFTCGYQWNISNR